MAPQTVPTIQGPALTSSGLRGGSGGTPPVRSGTVRNLEEILKSHPGLAMVCVVAIVLIPYILRLLLIGRFNLGNDEAHYYMYAVHPDLSFFDHPLMIGLLIGKSLAWWGHTEFAVRFFAPTLFAVSSVLLGFCAWSFIPSWTFVLFVLILLNAVPLFGLLGSTLMIPDDPLSVLWLLYFFLTLSILPRIADKTASERWIAWCLMGSVFGLALLSKYNAILLPLMTAGIMSTQRPMRKYLFETAPWLGLALGFVVAWPLFYWNYLHQGASFFFQAKHGIGGLSFDWVPFYQMVFGQIGYVSPILWGLILLSLVYSARRSGSLPDPVQGTRWLILSWFGLFPIGFFNLIGIFHPILPHWPAMGYLAGVLSLALMVWNGGSSKIRKWNRAGMAVGFGLSALVLLQLFFQIVPLPGTFPNKVALTNRFPYIRSESKAVPRWVDITNDLFGFKRLARHIRSIEPAPLVSGSFFVSDHFNTADELAFYMKAPYRTLCLEPGANQFDFWTDPARFLGQNGLFVSTDKYPTDPRSLYPTGTFREIIPEKPFSIYRKGRLARTFYIYRLIGFQKIPWKKIPRTS